jgi:uncharacterized protein (DUF302 family)
MFRKVDTEAEPTLSAVANITSIPTLMAFKDGALVFSQPVALPAAAMEQVIAAVRGRRGRPALGNRLSGEAGVMTYTLNTIVRGGYEETVAAVRAALPDQGFGVPTEIDLAGTLKAKLDVDIPALLPCNVVVRAVGEDACVVEAFDPDVMMSFSDSDAVRAVAQDAKQRLTAALASL